MATAKLSDVLTAASAHVKQSFLASPGISGHFFRINAGWQHSQPSCFSAAQSL